ncbi:MAG: hypothetical protein H6613_03370 [Ignavibacteriales bacterium]|nr:hypothetical protein [Ignavibacteriales bacterium]
MFYSDNEDTEGNYLRAISQREYFGKMVQRPKSVWWVKINSTKGEGWLKLINETPYCFSIKEKISGKDGCE